MLEAGKCMIKKFLLTVLLILTFSCGAVFASIDNPKFNGLVADEAGMLMPDAEKKINQTLKDIKKKTGITVATILLKSINGQPIKVIGDNFLNNITSMSKINWKKINESLKASATSFKEAGEEFFSGVKASVVELNEDKRPSRDEIFEMVKNNPNLTSEEIAEMVRKASLTDEEREENLLNELREKVLEGYEALKNKGSEFLENSELVEKLGNKIQKMIDDKDVKELREVLTMESSLNDIIAGAKKFTKNIGQRVENSLKEVLEDKDKNQE